MPKKRCTIIRLDHRSITCLCGAHRILRNDDEWGVKAGYDFLLDWWLKHEKENL